MGRILGQKMGRILGRIIVAQVVNKLMSSGFSVIYFCLIFKF